MKKALLTFVFFTIVCIVTTAQTDIISKYKKTSAMIPMRDGVKLYTIVLSPVDAKTPMPILMQRTPYGAIIPIPDDTTIETKLLGNILATDG